MAKQAAPASKVSPVTPASRSALDYLGRPGVICLLLGLATFLVYCPVTRNGFVDYDDGDYVSANSHVETGLKWENIVWAFTTGHASNWHPLTWLSHMLDYQLLGRDPGAQHLVNLVFHIANSLLLFLILRRMTGAHLRSAMVAALFALHPLHVESVAWLSERKDVLSTLFLLLTLGAYTLYIESKIPSSESKAKDQRNPDAEIRPPPLQSFPARRSHARRSTGQPPSQSDPSSMPARGSSAAWYTMALLAFALGLMSKPMLVTLPFLLLLLDYWPFRRLKLDGAYLKITTLLPLFWEKVPFLALAALSSTITFIVQRRGGAVSTSLTLGQRVANAFVSYVRYIWKMVWPENLSVLYPHPLNWPVWQVIGSALLLALIFVLVVKFVRSRPYVPVGWFWFFGSLIPVIGLVQVGIQSMADRYTYVPLIGLFIALVWGVNEAAVRRNWQPRGPAVLAVLCLGICGLFTLRQVGFWRDSESLFRRAIEVTPTNYLAYNNLGYYLANHGRASEAMEYYRKSIEINPTYEDALNNMGFALAGQKRNAEAIPYYEAALRVRPAHVEVNNNLGNALSEVGRIDEAIQHYQIALREKPDHADAHNNLGIALAMQGKLDEAVWHFRAALRFKPRYASAHSNLGNALAAQQKWEEAVQEYQECLRLNPNDPQAHNNLGNVLAQQGKLDEAVQHYTEALRLNDNNPEAQFNLGMALLRQNKSDAARSHFAEALRLRPDYGEAKRQLATLDAAGKK